jgi:hypothetical protein
MKYRVSFEFRLTRRTIWAADGIDFYDHATAVAEKIGSHEFVSDVRVIADRSESVLTVDFAQEASDHNEIVPAALGVVREAIEAAGGRHFGMDTTAAGMLVGAGAGPGLDTPIWQKRRVVIDLAA